MRGIKANEWARAAAVTMLSGLSLAGCAVVEPPEAISPSAGLGCVDDSADCIGKRQAALKAFIGDKDHKWVREPASAEAYASGVRLFAFKTKKKELTCEQLMIGRREADAGPAVLRSSGGGKLTPAQVSRGAMLASEVGRELSREHERRCKRT